jgi:pterin-4a-carbinolamine dehydratase
MTAPPRTLWRTGARRRPWRSGGCGLLEKGVSKHRVWTALLISSLRSKSLMIAARFSEYGECLQEATHIPRKELAVNPSIFVSYRREVSAAEAGRLTGNLVGHFGEQAVFMDTPSLQPGMKWPTSIRSALDSARAVVVVIGLKWLGVSEESGRRRIDTKSDWVRKELEIALAKEKEVIPVLVAGSRMPRAEWLPKAIVEVCDRQALEIRNEYWDHDIKLLISRLEGLDSVPAANKPATRYPRPGPVLPDPISDDALDALLKSTITGWKKIVGALPDKPDSIELCREYRFKSFLDVIRFMSEVAPGCNILNHHPRWENVWRTLTVCVTTWDIGNRISDRDIRLAQYFDEAYSGFPEADP